MAVDRLASSIEEVPTESCTSTVLAHLLKAVSHAANDLGEKLCEWLTAGAPGGFTWNFSALDGLLPRVDPKDKEDPSELTTDRDEFVNFTGVDDDEDAADLIRNNVSQNYLTKT